MKPDSSRELLFDRQVVLQNVRVLEIGVVHLQSFPKLRETEIGGIGISVDVNKRKREILSRLGYLGLSGKRWNAVGCLGQQGPNVGNVPVYAEAPTDRRPPVAAHVPSKSDAWTPIPQRPIVVEDPTGPVGGGSP